MDIIQIHELTKDYGDHKGIFDVSFSIKEGESFGFLGPNGAGKTTTIRHLMGFINADKGRCTIKGMDCKQEAQRIQQYLGYVPGEIALPEDMTGMEFIEFMAAYRGLKELTLAHRLIERFELNPKGKIKKMSKGMKQKLGIVTAFMHNPEVLILDEPTGGLDPLMQNRFIDLITEQKQQGKTILMSSHLFEEVERTCDRVGMIKQGELKAIDTIEELKATQKRTYIVVFEDEAQAAVFAAEPLQIVAHEANRVTVSVQQDMNLFIASLHRFSIKDLKAKEQSLEEVFLHYYSDIQ